MHEAFTHEMDARAWALVGPHGYQDDPATCEICRIVELVTATRRPEGRHEVVTIRFNGPAAAKAARWVADQLGEARFDKHGPRLQRVLEVEHALLVTRCAGAGWLDWAEITD